MTDIANFKDPILSLVRDPNLNKDKDKCTQIANLIKDISERRLNKLCSTIYIILQTLEKIQLKFKSWEFLSLDYNSNTHFENHDDKIKIFNTGVADKVMQACRELNFKVTKIAGDIDLVSKSSRSLSVSDLISDEGTMLTSLLLRVIKLKDEIVEQLSISYSKAKLILIGRDLELMHNDEYDSDEEGDEEDDTVNYYKTFIVTLLKQLNDAILANDFDSKFECLAVINDLEKMFEKYKMERMIDRRIKEYDEEHRYQLQLQQEQKQSQSQKQQSEPQSQQSQPQSQQSQPQTQQPQPQAHHKHINSQQHYHESTPKSNLHFGYDEEVSSPSEREFPGLDDSFSEYSMTSSSAAFQGQLPMVRSITQLKHQRQASAGSAFGSSSRDFYDYELSNGGSMYKSSITEELPYLRTAFDSAKNFENDVSQYRQEAGVHEEEDEDGSEKENRGVSGSKKLRRKRKYQKKSKQSHYKGDIDVVEEGEEEEDQESQAKKQPYFHKASNLPQSSLYTQSQILQPHGIGGGSSSTTPASFLNNNSLLRTLGIRPQVINVPQEHTQSLVKSKSTLNSNSKRQIEDTKETQDKEKEKERPSLQQQKYLPLSEENIHHLNQEYDID
ncbi:hypothetical protein I9W82_002267 [Candida metapsilosis]|uniref:Uncharacterized protein n=1 Tax=Candida metapsilosis TaxID=273372 RepID=A0A8H7ZI18_9ASCO|nr:hypothetical protein I9W82_002267 [Candida metapsilosis]